MDDPSFNPARFLILQLANCKRHEGIDSAEWSGGTVAGIRDSEIQFTSLIRLYFPHMPELSLLYIIST